MFGHLRAAREQASGSRSSRQPSRVYQPKLCLTCGLRFQPTGPNTKSCRSCKPVKNATVAPAAKSTPAPARVTTARLTPYKPGTRQLPAKSANTITGDLPWWASTDPEVWKENQTRMHDRQRSSADNILDWRLTGLAGGGYA